ncbi:unnamed protein product, partial [marine sediment metagenome]
TSVENNTASMYYLGSVKNPNASTSRKVYPYML